MNPVISMSAWRFFIERKLILRVVIFISIAFFIDYGCASKHVKASEEKPYNVIMICLDTLRADHLGCYGYKRNTSPNIDRFAKQGILFKWAISQSSFTLPSHASMFTSRYVHHHNVDRLERYLLPEETTLAEVLKSHGYATAAFIYNAPQLYPKFGLNQGFDTYSFGYEKNKEISFKKTLPSALKWITAHQKERFFVFLHSYDIHAPYHSPLENIFDPSYKGRLDKEYMSSYRRDGSENTFHSNNFHRTPREIEHIIAHYDGGIRYADIYVGKLLRFLENTGLMESTIVIIFSDHGEILFDRGKRIHHGFSLHDEEVHVALIVRHPKLKDMAKCIQKQVQLVDVMPTLLDFLGISYSTLALDGRSLSRLMTQGSDSSLQEVALAECLKGESEKKGVLNRQVMVRTPLWKLIGSVWNIREDLKKTLPREVKINPHLTITLPQEDGYELYNLKNDPKEKMNLITKKNTAKIQFEMMKRLLLYFP